MLKLLHSTAIAINLFGFWYDQNYVDNPFLRKNAELPLKGRIIYLTIWTLMLQTLYFTVALLNDLIGTNDYSPSRKPLIRKLKDALFCSLAFPLAMFVGTTFWGLYAVDRELVFPKVLDEFFPVWLNHLMHTNIMVFILIELMATFRMYPGRKYGISTLIVFMLAYITWIHVIYFKSDQWVYPILEVLSWPLRIVFYLFSLALVLVMYVLGEKLNRILWPKQVAQIVKSEKKKAR